MSVSYDNLWAILKKKKMTKKRLMEEANISPTTVQLLSHNKVVSMSTIISICKFLRCDIGDVVRLATEEQDAKQAISKYVYELNEPKVLKRAVENYLRTKGASKNSFVKATKISPNTLKKILEEKPINLSTYNKLMNFIDQELLHNVDIFLGAK